MSDSLRERLARLRREGGRPLDARGARPAQDTGGRLPLWLRARLAARDRRRGDGASGRGEEDVAGGGSGRRPGLPAELIASRNERGSFLARTRNFSLSHRHGDVPLAWVDGIDRSALALLGKDVALRGLDPHRAVYLDVETTGLSGGAGTTSFLIALGSFEGERFVLWQGFLGGPEEEPALLAEVARRIARADAVVSFFGKSFDRHRLEDKMRVHGVEPPFAGRPHLDLYHPLRRLYGPAFLDHRLQTMERALCGVRRPADLPGRFAPEAWLDFLAGRAHRLEEVFQHNEDDVLSLVVLAAHLGRCVAGRWPEGEPLAGPSAPRLLAVGRLLARTEPSRALAVLERLETEEDASASLRREGALTRAELFARLGRASAALELLTVLTGGPRERLSYDAALRGAKLCEHALRDDARALEFCAQAEELARVVLPSGPRERALAELAHRTARLRGRASTARSGDVAGEDAPNRLG